MPAVATGQVFKDALEVLMQREYDLRTGRPLTDGRDLIPALTDEEIEAEVTIAAAEPRLRSERLEALLRERRQRRRRALLRSV